MSMNLTLAALSQPRNRPSMQPQALLTAAEKKEKQHVSAETKAAMDAELAQLQSYIKNKAIELGKRFDKQPRYFLDIIYQAGARMVHAQEKTNPYNAFKSEKAAQLRDEGRAMKAPELHTKFYAEYEAMTAQEKKDMVARWEKEVKNEVPKLQHDTPMVHIRDFSNTVKNMEQLMHGLSYRVGVEGFFCIIRNSTDFHIEPQWYFTSVELERYLPLAVGCKWDQGTVGPRLEAFAIAGCDTMNLLRTAPQKAEFMKGEIRDYVKSGLVKITGKQIDMEYVHHEELIVLRYSVKLVGWTADKFVNPSELSSSLGALTTLCDALKNGDCRWEKLSCEEWHN